MWLGKIIGVVLGLMILGPVGVLLGLLAGHAYDLSVQGSRGRPRPAQRAEVQEQFLATVFRLMGYLAKSDGRISEQEIAGVEQFMGQLGLTSTHRREAIRLFKEGAEPDFSLDDTMIRFQSICGNYHQLHPVLLEYLFHIAFADGKLEPEEIRILEAVATWLRIPGRTFERLLAMYRAQQGFAGGQAAPQRSAAQQLAEAYVALGVDPSVSDRELKSAYRKLMSKHHPDKLAAQGVPPDMLKVATEKAQEITAAYDLVSRHRTAS